MDFLQTLSQKLSWHYVKLENFLIKDETDKNIQIKKKMAVYYCYLLACYFILLPFFNSYASLSGVLLNLMTTCVYLIVLKLKNYSLIVSFFHAYSLLGLYIASKSPGAFLRVIGISLCQHNQAFLVTNSRIMRILYLIAAYFLVTKIQGKFDDLVQDNNITEIILAVKSFQYSWPLLFVFNHCASTHMAQEYCKALEVSQKAQKELEIKNQELSSLNGKLQAALNLVEHANKELKEAIKVRELFIASVSHELRNPLNSMLGNIELLGLEVRDPRWLKMLDTCKICGETLLGLINNILDVAKINAEKIELNCQPSNFHRVIEKVWAMTTTKMREKGLRGCLKIAGNVPKYIKMDCHRINQILLNLVGNASKFTNTGFVKVIITWFENKNDPAIREPSQEFTEWVRKKENLNLSPRVSQTKDEYRSLINKSHEEMITDYDQDYNLNVLQRIFHTKSFSNIRFNNTFIFNETETKILDRLPTNVDSYKNRGILKIEIIDSGCGISKKADKRLFQAFSQVDSSITRKFGGTGLGLYITKQLIQRMGGQIYVESKEKIGSDFWVVIPCERSTKEEVEKIPVEQENKREIAFSKKVIALVVDDDPLNQMIMTNYFNKMNIQADIANNGQEALYKFKTQETGYYSLITMDLQMPIMDGLTACKEIRKYEKNIGAKEIVPIAIVTGNCMDIEKNRWLDPLGEIRASFIFRKPFAFEECQLCVGKILAQYEDKIVNQNKRLKVLIIDNDSYNANIAKEFLEKYSYLCQLWYKGRESLLETAKQDFDVILMDCQLPNMDVYSIVRQIRAKNPKVIIIGVTEDACEDGITKAKGNGMNSVEIKPVNLNRLVKTIENLRNVSFLS